MAHPLIPLLILFIVLCFAGFVGYVVYSIANDIADKTSKKMDKHNVSFGKDGMKIGVKQIKEEDYVAQTQSMFVKAWNYSEWPAYKSRIWNKEQPASGKASGSSSRQQSMGATKR